MNSKLSLTSLQKLIEIMALLRSEKGCQWDRKQTPESLKKHTLEETYELLEAIDNGSPDEICDELGDLLLQIVFQAQIFSEMELFSIDDIAEGICNKLIRRHPHIFADDGHADHEKRWEKIKLQERSSRGQSNSLNQRIPKALPSLKRATKAFKAMPAIDGESIIERMQTEILNISKEFPVNDHTQMLEHQLGELLFSACRIAATCEIDLEDLLRKKTTQLIAEFDNGNDVS